MRFIVFVFMFFSSFCFGQNVIVSNPTQNLLYLGVSNPIDIYVEGVKCYQLNIKVDNGEIEGESKNCNYLIRPERIGDVVISIYNKGNLIVEKRLLVIEPELVAKIDIPRDSEGSLLVERSMGISVDLKHHHIAFAYSQSSIEYELIIINGHNVVYRNIFKDYVFNDELKKELIKVDKNDLIIFTNIHIKLESGKNYPIQDIVLKKN